MTAAAQARTRLERIRASAGIAQLALQQIQGDVTADDVDAAELAAILLELSADTDSPGGLVASGAQLLTVDAHRAERIGPDRDGLAGCSGTTLLLECVPYPGRKAPREDMKW
ncbi:hypothetical protein ACFXKI_32585 [Streptomyces mirabilis]|uniref:hypothetical protein n=1 Tax=Streptomyces mirabilis TaxID=68239 RepID=UPI003676278A